MKGEEILPIYTASECHVSFLTKVGQELRSLSKAIVKTFSLKVTVNRSVETAFITSRFSWKMRSGQYFSTLPFVHVLLEMQNNAVRLRRVYLPDIQSQRKWIFIHVYKCSIVIQSCHECEKRAKRASSNASGDINILWKNRLESTRWCFVMHSRWHRRLISFRFRRREFAEQLALHERPLNVM